MVLTYILCSALAVVAAAHSSSLSAHLSEGLCSGPCPAQSKEALVFVQRLASKLPSNDQAGDPADDVANEVEKQAHDDDEYEDEAVELTESDKKNVSQNPAILTDVDESPSMVADGCDDQVCVNSAKDWSTKCGWKAKCGGCPVCLYALGNMGSNECPTGSVGLTLSECKAATKAFNKGYGQTKTWQSRQKGCSMGGESNKVTFNTHPTGSPKESRQLICKPETNPTVTGPTPPPTPENPNCQAMCATSSQPWEKKCAWGKCKQCADCGEQEVTEPTPPPTPAKPNCQAMCANSGKTWEVKCKWTRTCGGCGECATPAPTEAPTTAHPTPPAGTCTTSKGSCIFPFTGPYDLEFNACIRYTATGGTSWCKTGSGPRDTAGCPKGCDATWAGWVGGGTNKTPVQPGYDLTCPPKSKTDGKCGPEYGRCNGNAQGLYCEGDGECQEKPKCYINNHHLYGCSADGYTPRNTVYDAVPSLSNGGMYGCTP
jgi:hypothetical protein